MNYRIWLIGVTLLAVILLLLQAAFIAKYREIIPQHDPTYYYSYVRSAVVDHDLNLENEYQHFKINNYETSSTGYPVNTYTIGFPLLVLPFYALIHAVIDFLNHCGLAIKAYGYGKPYQLAFCLGSIFYGFIGLNLCFSILRRYFSEKISIISLSLTIFTTNLFYYFAVEPFMSHVCSFFSVSLFFYLWNKTLTNGKQSYYFWLGIAAGLMILVRQQNAAFIVVALIGFLWRGASWRMGDLSKSMALAVCGLLLGLSPQLLAWKEIFGSWLVYSYGQQSFIYKFDPQIFQVLFSSRHGLLSWHPIIIICLIGVLLSTRKYPRLGVLLFTGFLLQLYITSSWWCWWLGNSFGNRAFVSCSLIFSFGLAYILSQEIIKIKSWKFIASSMVLVAWNMLLAVSYLTKFIPQTKSFLWSNLLMNVWQLPTHIIYRINNF
jgi:hypothetical protein